MLVMTDKPSSALQTGLLVTGVLLSLSILGGLYLIIRRNNSHQEIDEPIVLGASVHSTMHPFVRMHNEENASYEIPPGSQPIEFWSKQNASRTSTSTAKLSI